MDKQKKFEIKEDEIISVYRDGMAIIGEVVYSDSTCIILSNPITITPTPNGRGLAPCLFDEEFILVPNNDVLIGSPSVDLKNKYKELSTKIKARRAGLVEPDMMGMGMNGTMNMNDKVTKMNN